MSTVLWPRLGSARPGAAANCTGYLCGFNPKLPFVSYQRPKRACLALFLGPSLARRAVSAWLRPCQPGYGRPIYMFLPLHTRYSTNEKASEEYQILNEYKLLKPDLKVRALPCLVLGCRGAVGWLIQVQPTTRWPKQWRCSNGVGASHPLHRCCFQSAAISYQATLGPRWYVC